jgi:hypothetical protein
MTGFDYMDWGISSFVVLISIQDSTSSRLIVASVFGYFQSDSYSFRPSVHRLVRNRCYFMCGVSVVTIREC